MYTDKDEFRIIGQSISTYSDGTEVPHLEVAVYRNGIYRGYVEIHTHKVSDDSISIGTTTRWETLKKP